MHVGQIKIADTANGLGIRVSIFVSGCTNHCKGCFQPETWSFTYGQEYTKEIENSILEELSKPHYKGLTILGGEPFEPENQTMLIKLIRRVKAELPTKDIWMYTGFTYDKNLIQGGSKHTEVTDEILDNIDILVDGKFMEEQKNIMLKFRGSENQRVIDMRETRAQNKIILFKF